MRGEHGGLELQFADYDRVRLRTLRGCSLDAITWFLRPRRA